MSEEKVMQQERETRAKTPSRKRSKKQKGTLEAAIIGQYCVFYGKMSSGFETVDGVPMEIFTDPDGRSLIKLFSSDGARAYLYLDQVATFTTQPQAPQEQSPRSQQFQFDMTQPPPASAGAQGVGREYYSQPQQPGQAVDEVYYKSGKGGSTPRRTERVSE